MLLSQNALERTVLKSRWDSYQSSHTASWEKNPLEGLCCFQRTTPQSLNIHKMLTPERPRLTLLRKESMKSNLIIWQKTSKVKSIIFNQKAICSLVCDLSVDDESISHYTRKYNILVSKMIWASQLFIWFLVRSTHPSIPDSLVLITYRNMRIVWNKLFLPYNRKQDAFMLLLYSRRGHSVRCMTETSVLMPWAFWIFWDIY